MPCFSMSSIQTDLEGRDPALLKTALEAMGFTVRMTGDRLSFAGTEKETGKYAEGTYINGKLQASRSLNITEVKQSYAASVLKKNAAKYGWQLKQTGKYNYQVTKR